MLETRGIDSATLEPPMCIMTRCGECECFSDLLSDPCCYLRHSAPASVGICTMGGFDGVSEGYELVDANEEACVDMWGQDIH